jgi:glycine betaine/proline transport system permease protein
VITIGPKKSKTNYEIEAVTRIDLIFGYIKTNAYIKNILKKENPEIVIIESLQNVLSEILINISSKMKIKNILISHGISIAPYKFKIKYILRSIIWIPYLLILFFLLKKVDILLTLDSNPNSLRHLDTIFYKKFYNKKTLYEYNNFSRLENNQFSAQKFKKKTKSILLIGYLGMWNNTMSTVALISVATFICIALGIPIGVAMSKSDRLQAMITPVLDIMQTIPIFVYLLPVVMLLGIGKVPGLIAVCVYAMPPIVRLTNLGLRLVDKEILEAADAFGSNYQQRLFKVQLPLALPNIFAGVNQTIMMALAMVVIASMIGVKGLGVPVLQSIQNQYLALGMMNGLAIVALAIIFDRVSQQYGKRLQRHREGGSDV